MAQQLAKADLEALLRTHKLDNTLPTALPGDARDEQAVVGTGIPALDRRLDGGFPRGQMSEIVGPRSSGRLSLLLATLAVATARGEAVALIDPLDMLDVPATDASGVDLARLLWVRGCQLSTPSPDTWFRDTRGRRGAADEPGEPLDRAVERAVKAFNLVLQAGGFGVVALDLAEVPAMATKRLPFTTWLRLQRGVEASQTVCLILGARATARSAGGVTLELSRPSPVEQRAAGAGNLRDNLRRVGGRVDHPLGARWLESHAKTKLFLGLDVEVRIIRSRWGDDTPCRIRVEA
jgi:recombination protein RecA